MDLLCNLANLSCAPEKHPAPKCAMESDRESHSGAGSHSVITSPKADQHLEPNQNGKPLKQSKKKIEQRGHLESGESRGQLYNPEMLLL